MDAYPTKHAAPISFSTYAPCWMWLSAVFFVVCTASCSKTSPLNPTPPTSTSNAANATEKTARPPALNQPTCVAQRGVCTDAQHVRTCIDGHYAPTPVLCPTGTTCLDHGCVSLRTPEGALDASQLFALAPESGWIQRWSQGPLTPWEALQTQTPPARQSASQWETLHASSRTVSWMRNAPVSSKKRDLLGRWHAVTLISDHDQEVTAWASANGHLRVFLDTREVMRIVRDTRAALFPDEHSATLRLSKGVHTLFVQTGQTRTSWRGSFMLRLRDAQNRPVRGVRIAPLQANSLPKLSELVSVRVTQKLLNADGFSFRVEPAYTGLSLPSVDPHTVSLSLLLADGTQRVLKASQIDPTDQTRTSFPALDASVQGLPDGTHKLYVTLRDQTVHVHTFTTRNGLQKRLHALQSTTFPPNAPPSSRTSWTHHLQTLTKLFTSNDPDVKWLQEHLSRAESIAHAITTQPTQDPYNTTTGLVRRALLSPLDGNPQPYAVYLPESYDPKGDPLPVIVTFHGLDSLPEHALQVTAGRSPGRTTPHNARHVPNLGQRPAILVAPWGYKNAGQRLLGEYDTMQVLHDVLSVYNADPLRVSLTGYSLGGTVAFTVPLHYPGVFSSAAPLCGYPNLKGFRQIRSVPHTSWEDTLIEQKYIYNYVENGIYLPMYVVHGGKDGPERSEVIVRRYKRFGYRAIFDLQDDLGHNVWDYAYREKRITNWMRWRKRPQSPSRARLKTAHYRYNRAWWLRLIAAEDPVVFSSIFAERDKRSCAFKIETENTLIFEIDLASQRVDGQPYRPAQGVCTISIDEQRLTLPASQTRLILTRAKTSDPWALTDQEPERKGWKRHLVSGPLDDAILHKQLIVYGTQDPSHTHANLLTAQHLSTVDPHWDIVFPIKADRDVTEEDIASHTLVLIGKPSSNALTKRFANHLPVQFDDTSVTFAGERFAQPDTGVSLIHPHPINPEEYLVLHAGLSPQATLAARHLPRYQPDFLIYDTAMTTQRGGTLLDTRKALRGGFFGSDWSVLPKSPE